MTALTGGVASSNIDQVTTALLPNSSIKVSTVDDERIDTTVLLGTRFDSSGKRGREVHGHGCLFVDGEGTDTLLAFVPYVDDSFGTDSSSRHHDDEKVEGCDPHFGVDGFSWEDTV